jgi:hypothetical protein
MGVLLHKVDMRGGFDLSPRDKKLTRFSPLEKYQQEICHCFMS